MGDTTEALYLIKYSASVVSLPPQHSKGVIIHHPGVYYKHNTGCFVNTLCVNNKHHKGVLSTHFQVFTALLFSVIPTCITQEGHKE